MFGEGSADWKGIFAAAESVGGIEYYLIEQEGTTLLGGRIPQKGAYRTLLSEYKRQLTTKDTKVSFSGFTLVHLSRPWWYSVSLSITRSRKLFGTERTKLVLWLSTDLALNRKQAASEAFAWGRSRSHV